MKWGLGKKGGNLTSSLQGVAVDEVNALVADVGVGVEAQGGGVVGLREGGLTHQPRHHSKIYSVCLEHPTYHSVLSLPAVVLHCQSETVGGHAVTEAGVGNPAIKFTNTRWEVKHGSDIDIRV
jgi:hypothetical protein